MDVDFIINNKVSEQDFEKIVYKWLAEGDYTPDDIIENIITQNNITLVPIYFYKNEYYGSCSASLGYARQEYYYEWDDYNKKQIRKSRWVTDWHPHSQAVQGVTTTVVYAGTLVREEIATFVENMGWLKEELHSISDDTSHYEEIADLFKFSKEEMWNNRGIHKAYNDAVKKTTSELPSPLVQNLSLNINFSLTGFFSLVAPYWLFRYEYNEKEYYVIVDGNNPERIDGVKPEDQKRKNSVIKLKWFGWSVGLLAIVLALYFSSGESFGDIGLTWTNIGIVVGGLLFTGILVGIEVRKIKNKSLKIRQETLNRKLKRLN